ALLGRVVLHLRAVGEPIAVGDLGDLESAVSQISVLHDLSLRPSRLLWNPRTGRSARPERRRPGAQSSRNPPVSRAGVDGEACSAMWPRSVSANAAAPPERRWRVSASCSAMISAQRSS